MWSVCQPPIKAANAGSVSSRRHAIARFLSASGFWSHLAQLKLTQLALVRGEGVELRRGTPRVAGGAIELSRGSGLQLRRTVQTIQPALASSADRSAPINRRSFDRSPRYCALRLLAHCAPRRLAHCAPRHAIQRAASFSAVVHCRHSLPLFAAVVHWWSSLTLGGDLGQSSSPDHRLTGSQDHRSTACDW